VLFNSFLCRRKKSIKLPDAILSKNPWRKGERKMLAISAIFSSLEIKGNEGRRLQIRSDSKLCFALTRKKWTYFDREGNIKINLIN
jgi:hypothetical protein